MLFYIICVFFLCSVCRGNDYEATSEPLIVKYNSNDALNVYLQLINVPDEFPSYKYEIRSITNNLPSSFLRGILTPKEINIKLNGLKNANNHTILEVVLTSNAYPFVNCNKHGNRRFIQLLYTYKKSHPDCLSKPCTITMDWGNYCERKPIESDSSYKFHENSYLTPSTSPQLRVFPETFQDHGDQFMVFNCSVVRWKPLGVLFWYQVKTEGGKESKPEKLKTYQAPTSSGKETQLSLVLNKTLEPSDKGTKIYCAFKYESEGSNTIEPIEIKSKTIKIMINRTIQPLEKPYLIVAPSTNPFYFEISTNVSFVCDGSPPLDDRRRTWYIQDPNSSLSTLAPHQTMDPVTKTNTLQMYLNESSHQQTIYCTQEHHMYYKNAHEFVLWRYGVVAFSDKITLLLRDESSADVQTIILGCAAGLAALTLLILALVMTWRRRAVHVPKDQGICEDEYVTPQVTYAILDLPESETTPLPTSKAKASNYVKIIGSLQPKKRNKQ